MRKSVISYHIGGFEKLVKALGKFKGDPYDVAVKRLKAKKKPKKKESTK